MNDKKDYRSYLGDGVYIDFDGFGYVLRANHHEHGKCSDEIYLEPSVFHNLLSYHNRLIESIKNEQSINEQPQSKQPNHLQDATNRDKNND